MRVVSVGGVMVTSASVLRGVGSVDSSLRSDIRFDLFAGAGAGAGLCKD
jgi:hypothetical protein